MSSHMSSYAVELVTRYDGLVIATFPDLPGLSALGRDDEEALSEAERALADHVRTGAPLPAPAAPGATRVAAPVILA